METRPAGVGFRGPLELGYRACLWSRIASRILLQLDRFPAPDPQALYSGAVDFPFEEHFTTEQTFAVEFTSTLSAITHTNFGALKVKDAIADRFRNRSGIRPSVDRELPDLRFHMHIHADVATLSLDLSGERLHRRAWRAQAQEAPLKENLASGVLRLAQWPETFQKGGGLVDPMCGSGTLLVEAALLALDVAPGLLRSGFGFERWAFHQHEIWNRLLVEAAQRDRRKGETALHIAGSDNDDAAVQAAQRNLAEAGIRGVEVFRRELAMAEPVGDIPGIVVTNPPYGIRIGVGTSLDLLYRRLGMTLKSRFPMWTGYVLTGNAEAAKQLGLRTTRRHILYNGAIECRLLEIPILPPRTPEAGDSSDDGIPPGDIKSPERVEAVVSDGVQAFANRVRKNLAGLRKWRDREQVTCYRIYDGDLPEYALTIDLYDRWVHIQESERPNTIDPLKAEARLHDALVTLPELLNVAPENLFVKQRFRQRGTQQYGRFGNTGSFHEVKEGGLKFMVNLADYFDAGLFLDHRPIRTMIRDLVRDKHFLNLFAYTGSATVYASAGDARSTTTVDMSSTYLSWAQMNMERNGFVGARHVYINDDAVEWMKHQRITYDVVFLDPPTFSNSKSMRGTFDVQRDHVSLVRDVMSVLSPDGVLLFSNNFRKFQLDRPSLADLDIQDITRETIPPDFVRDPKAHQAFMIRKRPK